jgi:hypothetical protein
MARRNPEIGRRLNDSAEYAATFLILDGNRLGLKLFSSQSIHPKEACFRSKIG